jgi:segregation and condensation protein B
MEPTKQTLEEIDESQEIENTKKIEAALFIAGRFLSLQELITLTDVNPILLKKILSDLKDKYSPSGIQIIERNGLFKMDVSEEHTEIVSKLATGSSEFTKAEQETLAIVAYKQPMKQSVLIKIRGNKAYDHVKKYVQMNLIHKKKTGHTSELTLTENFFDYFHISKGEKLPDLS